MNRFRLIAYFHLLWTAVMAALTLLLSMRFPYPETTRWFRLTLALLAASGLSVLPLFGAASLSILWLPLLVFIAATVAFAIFSVQVIRTHLKRLRR